ncbi:hypothetical protein H9649_08080 [Sporosarcina sp. Sa2YVA2]|uniref:SnoaL-like domain-containing protein n=1 Tax=Sporosarcina quadrami TaxID=2762234 RepID=A0ABR8U924_9BACL|nr:hypothetical protein [Sporosarcina quadrami]MBD7984534.1 hypothetical protein [Sporosarcina quadrami]
MHTSAYIWGDYPETETLIKRLRENGTELITVVTDEAGSKMNKFDGVVYVTSDLMNDGRLEETKEVHYKYVARQERRDGQAWKMHLVQEV